MAKVLSKGVSIGLFVVLLIFVIPAGAEGEEAGDPTVRENTVYDSMNWVKGEIADEPQPLGDEEEPRPLGGEDPQPLGNGGEGLIYGGAYGNFFIYNPNDDSFINKGTAVPGEKTVADVITHFDGKIYGGTGDHSHLFEYNPETDLITDKGSITSEKMLRVITPGFDSKIYGGTILWKDLFVVYDLVSGSTDIRDLGNTADFFSITTAPDGKIYFGEGFPYAHLYKYDPDTDLIEDKWVFIKESYAEDMTVGLEGKIYVGMCSHNISYAHLYVYDPVLDTVTDLGKARSDNDCIHALTTGLDGTIYGGTRRMDYTTNSTAQGGYFFIYDPNSNTFTDKGKPLGGSEYIGALTTGTDGKIYGGTGTFLFVYDPDTDSITVKEEPVPGATIFTLTTGLPTEGTAECIYLDNYATNYINEDTILCNETYLDAHVIIKASDITLDCNGSTLDGIDGFGYGIDLSNQDGITVKNCKILNYKEGIRMHTSNNNVVENNEIWDCEWYGIRIQYADNNLVTENDIYITSKPEATTGIALTSAHSNTISNNKIHNHGYRGIQLIHTSTKNLIENNEIYDNNYEGLIIAGANDNTIKSNNIHDNRDGLHAYVFSTGNLIYDNKLTDNTLSNAIDDNTGTNTWNTDQQPGPNIIGGQDIGGNYYSDYTGTDTDGDGIGETPYAIPGPGSAIDYLPLTNN